MGSTFTFVHCADLHIGSRFRGIGGADASLERDISSAQTESFRSIVDLAVREGASALVVSGDVYDGGNYLPSARAEVAGLLGRAGMPVFLCRGNHDFRTPWESSIPYPPNVHEFGTEPESFDVDCPGGRFRVTGVSFADQHEERNLAAMLRGSPDMFSIACVHCDVDAVSEGRRYAPCRMSDLLGRDIDYWALGHIHKRTVLSKDPYAVYPGVIQGRSIRETGEKGAYVVTVTDGRVSGFRFVPTQKYVWKETEADITGLDLEALADSLDAGKDEVVRITFTGSGGLDRMLRTQWEDVSRMISERRGCVLLEPRIRTSPDAPGTSPGALEEAVRARGAEVSALGRDGIVEAICGHRMAARYRSFFEGMSDEALRELVDDAVSEVISGMRAVQ